MIAPTPYVAQKFVASSPDAKIMGLALVALIQNLRADEIRPTLKKYGLETIDPNEWYPQQLILDFYRAIDEAQINAMENLVAIGMKFIDTVPPNPDIKSLEDAIRLLSAVTAQTERNIPESETFAIAKSEPHHMLVIANMPFPDDLLYGFIWATVRRYKPANVNFTVKMIANPDPAKYPGTAYDVTWQ